MDIVNIAITIANTKAGPNSLAALAYVTIKYEEPHICCIYKKSYNDPSIGYYVALPSRFYEGTDYEERNGLKSVIMNKFFEALEDENKPNMIKNSIKNKFYGGG